MWYLKSNTGVLTRIFLFLSLIVNAVTAQPQPPGSVITAEPSSLRLTVTIDARRQQQAYLSYLAAQRLKSEAVRMRSLRLFEEAVKVFKQTIALDPSAAEPHLDLGEVYFFYLARPELAER